MTARVWVVPAVVASLAVAGLLGASLISVPTLTHSFDPGFEGERATTVLTVDGVRCWGTADFLREHIEHVPGLVSMVAYAGKHRVVIVYSPGAVDVEEIISEIERPIETDDGNLMFFDVISSEAK
ncbi:MAG: hypothetical protein PVF95_01060 [bacterium]